MLLKYRDKSSNINKSNTEGGGLNMSNIENTSNEQVPKKINTVRLNTASKVTKFMANVINQLNQGKIDPNKARALGYLCSVQLQGIEKAELEKKIEELETKIKGRY
jgi:hypothetical protein